MRRAIADHYGKGNATYADVKSTIESLVDEDLKCIWSEYEQAIEDGEDE